MKRFIESVFFASGAKLDTFPKSSPLCRKKVLNSSICIFDHFRAGKKHMKDSCFNRIPAAHSGKHTQDDRIEHPLSGRIHLNANH